jgi:transcriptional regulator with XRE-family HTH domain
MAAVAEDPVSELGRLVRDRRHGAGLTQQALASLVGVSVATVRDLEQGRTRRPRRVLLDRLWVALDLPPEQPPEPGSGSAARPPAAPVRAGAALRVNILGPVTAWRDGRPLALGAASGPAGPAHRGRGRRTRGRGGRCGGRGVVRG